MLRNCAEGDLMALFRRNTPHFLSLFGAAALSMIFAASTARVPLTYFHAAPSARPSFAAILSDADTGTRMDLAGHGDKVPCLAPDGQTAGMIQRPLRSPVQSTISPLLAGIRFILPMHILYTQLTSSAL